MTRVRKAVVAALTGLAQVLNVGLVHGTAFQVCTAIIGLAGVYGVYRAPNAA